MTPSERGRFTVRVRDHKQLSPSCHLLEFERPDAFPEAHPGQFVSIRVSDSTVPLLRRPYSIMDLTATAISLLVKVVGRGSAALAGKRTGEEVDLIGPLGGTGFPAPRKESAVCIAGGTGLAPLLCAARAWRRERRSVNTVLLYGASTKDELLRELVEKDFDECSFATLDGSSGFHGDVVELSEVLLKEGRIRQGVLYSCGPRGMVRAVVDEIAVRFVDHYTSLECIMACGLGACRGCTVPVKADGGSVLRTVCSDGTVFKASDVAWGEWEE